MAGCFLCLPLLCVAVHLLQMQAYSVRSEHCVIVCFYMLPYLTFNRNVLPCFKEGCIMHGTEWVYCTMCCHA